MRAKLIVVFLLGIVVGIALTATLWRPASGGRYLEPAERDLTPEELQNVTGLVGVSNAGDLCGELYNGNRELSVTEVELRIVTFADGDSTARSYRYSSPDSAIAPLGTREFCVGLLLDTGEDFGWGLVGARGLEASP